MGATDALHRHLLPPPLPPALLRVQRGLPVQAKLAVQVQRGSRVLCGRVPSVAMVLNRVAKVFGREVAKGAGEPLEE